MGRREELVAVDVTLVREGDRAWLVRDAQGTEAWLPASRVDFPGGCRAGALVTLEVPEWLADDRGLEW